MLSYIYIMMNEIKKSFRRILWIKNINVALSYPVLEKSRGEYNHKLLLFALCYIIFESKYYSHTS